MIDIGNRVIELRKLHKISQNKLAISLNVAAATINKIEKNTAKPSIDLLIKICEFFSITLSEFFNDNSEHIVLTSELKELLNSAKDLTPSQLEALKMTAKAFKEGR